MWFVQLDTSVDGSRPVSRFAEYLKEVFELFGAIQARKMFGGYGLYHRSRMFGLVYDDMLYLKADAGNVRYFEALGLRPFEYDRNGKVTRMSYFLAPDDILDDREQAAEWARRSYEAALRTPVPKKRSKRKT